MALVRSDLPLWAVLALNLAEFTRQPAPAVLQGLFPGVPAHEVCACAEERAPPAAASAAAVPEGEASSKSPFLGIEPDDALVGLLAGLLVMAEPCCGDTVLVS